MAGQPLDKKNHDAAAPGPAAHDAGGRPDEAGRKIIFDNAARTARSLVQTFGRNCEIAVHDFRDLEHSLIHLEGAVTGRSRGAPITNLVIRAWRREGDAVHDLVNYPSNARNGHRLKSSTCFLRDAAGHVIGAFCINFDLTEFQAVQSAIESLTHLNAPSDAETSGENFAAYVTETNAAVFKAAVDKMGKPPASMNHEEKLAFIRILEGDGAFLVKGMVGYVAAAMNVSIYTVYNYLRQIKGDGGAAAKNPQGSTS